MFRVSGAAGSEEAKAEWALRPEPTAGIVRAYVEHGMQVRPGPLRLWMLGPMFRYDRPQAGRYRQFTQWDVEVLGDPGPMVDAELIELGHRFYAEAGIDNAVAYLNSIGDANCRPAYRQALIDYFAPHVDRLSDDSRRRLQVNPLRVLDDKRPAMQALLADAPLMIDHLCDSCREHFEQVRSVLDALGVRYVLNPRMVRGLDYYTRTTFEFVHPGLGAQSGMGGGGRYDGLMAELGGQSLSGIGFGLGVDRTLLASQAEGVLVGNQSRCEVYGVPMGAAASQRLAAISGELRRAGIRADMAYGGRALKTAMKAADATGARVALVLGDRELADGTVMVRDLRTGEQNPCPLGDVVSAVRSILQ
jgi:histidyl-tRNA synthetase